MQLLLGCQARPARHDTHPAPVTPPCCSLLGRQALCAAHWEAVQAAEAAARGVVPATSAAVPTPQAGGDAAPVNDADVRGWHGAAPALCTAAVYCPQLVCPAFLDWLKPRLAFHLQVRTCCCSEPVAWLPCWLPGGRCIVHGGLLAGQARLPACLCLGVVKCAPTLACMWVSMTPLPWSSLGQRYGFPLGCCAQ